MISFHALPAYHKKIYKNSRYLCKRVISAVKKGRERERKGKKMEKWENGKNETIKSLLTGSIERH